jgi:peptide/nickel transport system substrate-binding protein
MRGLGVRLLAIIATCTALLVTPGVAGATSAAGTPRKGGTLTVLSLLDNANGWDPIKFQGIPIFSETPVQFAVYDALFYVDQATLKLVPRLGLSLTTSDGGTTWTLKLRPNVQFSDGTPFDASAVQFNWQRIADPANKAFAVSAANVISSTSVVDPQTLKITLSAPNPNWNQIVANKLAWIGSPTAIKSAGANYGNKPVGAGPFLMQQWVKDSQYTLVRNPNYWDKGRPYLDQIIVKPITDETSRYNTFRAGDANVSFTADPTTMSQAATDKVKLITMSANAGGWSLSMNNTKTPFDDPRVRTAMDLALDRNQFNDTRRGGDPSSLVSTLETKRSPFYDPKITVPKYDLAGAQKLIDEVVRETGKPVTFSIDLGAASGSPVDDAQLLQAQLQKLKNVQISLVPQAGATLIAKINAGNYQSYTTTSNRWNEPSTDFVNVFHGGSNFNFSHYSNPTVDSMLDQLKSATDQKTRVQLVHSAEQQILKDSPVAWYTRFVSAEMIDKTVRNYNVVFDQVPLFDGVWLATKKG